MNKGLTEKSSQERMLVYNLVCYIFHMNMSTFAPYTAWILGLET